MTLLASALESLEWSEPRGPGCLIAFCGVDGAGKTTQINLLHSQLLESGVETVCTRQPTDWYRADPLVRRYLSSGGTTFEAHSLALFAAADRHRHCHEVVLPALERGAVVLCDRYVYSSLAYFHTRGVSASFVASINAGVVRPHAALFLDSEPATALERIRRRDGNATKFEERSEDAVSRIREAFLSMSAHMTVIRAQQSPDLTHRAVREALANSQLNALLTR